MPRLAALAGDGFQARLDPVLPAVTCTVQSTFLTGLAPADHGIVGNGWYFRDLGEVLLWRQHNRLVQGEKLWETARRARPGFRAANVCWWYAMGMTTDFTVTPRPVYHADGRKSPDCYTDPPELHDRLTGALGEFPLFSYWGPTRGHRLVALDRAGGPDAARRRATSTCRWSTSRTSTTIYQRFGPDAPEAAAAARELDAAAGDLVDHARDRGDTVVVLSEYGITDARRPVDVNRALRRAGLLDVYSQAGMEYLDPWTSRAFAVADHQVAHVYVRDPADVGAARAALAGLPGIELALAGDERRDAGLDHERAGELVLVAEPDAWFTYYYWLDDARAPDFARQVEIHRKPGYDPAELFMDPDDRLVKARAGAALARKKLGFRYVLGVVPLDPKPVRGTHGRLPGEADAAHAPVLLCSDPKLARDRIAATDVRDLLLELAGVTRVPA